MGKGLALLAMVALLAPTIAAGAIRAKATHRTPTHHGGHHRRRHVSAHAKPLAWRRPVALTPAGQVAGAGHRPASDFQGQPTRLNVENRLAPGVTASVGLESTGRGTGLDPSAVSAADASMRQPVNGLVGGKLSFRFK